MKYRRCWRSAPRLEWSSFFAVGMALAKIAGTEGGKRRPKYYNKYKCHLRKDGIYNFVRLILISICQRNCLCNLFVMLRQLFLLGLRRKSNRFLLLRAQLVSFCSLRSNAKDG